jgi:hypothetical protein
MCASLQIANPQIFLINPQITKLHISRKSDTTLSLNDLKSHLFKLFFYFVQAWVRNSQTHLICIGKSQKSAAFAEGSQI